MSKIPFPWATKQQTSYRFLYIFTSIYGGSYTSWDDVKNIRTRGQPTEFFLLFWGDLDVAGTSARPSSFYLYSDNTDVRFTDSNSWSCILRSVKARERFKKIWKKVSLLHFPVFQKIPLIRLCKSRFPKLFPVLLIYLFAWWLLWTIENIYLTNNYVKNIYSNTVFLSKCVLRKIIKGDEFSPKASTSHKASNFDHYTNWHSQRLNNQ